MKLNLLKKILSVALTSTFFLSLNILPAQAAGVCSGNIYWSNVNGYASPSSLGRAVIANSVVESVDNSYSTPTTAVADIQGDNNFLYFSDMDGNIIKFDRVTKISTSIDTSMGRIYSMVLKDGILYVGGAAKLVKFVVGTDGTLSGRTDIYASLGFGASKTIDGLAVDNQYLYYSTSTSIAAGQKFIGRAKLDGTEYNGNFITLPVTLDDVYHIEVNSNYIYWADYLTSIKRADLDGSNITTLISSNRMETFEIDSNYIYLDNWFGSAPYSIARANLDGTGLDLNYITTGSNPFGIYADTNSCTSSGSWVGAQSITCPAPNPWVKEQLGFASNVNPVLVSAENTIGKTITQGSYDALKSSGVVFDTVSTKVSTATETLPIYGCKDKLLSGKVNQPIQFIAGGYTLQSDAHGYINTADQKWHDINAVTLYTNTAAFMHTVKFTKAGKYVVVLTEKPDTSRGLIPTYGVRSIRFVINSN
ncbi:MAG: hypothetical protein WAO78_16345 [Roseovarius sp.]